MVWRGGEREWIRVSLLHHPISRGPQSPRLLRAASFSAATPSNKGVCGFSFSSLFRAKETAFETKNGGGKHAFSPFVSYAVVISPRLFGYDMAGDFKRWRTRLFLPFLGFLPPRFCLQNAVLSRTPWSVRLRHPCHSFREPPTAESSLLGQKINAAGSFARRLWYCLYSPRNSRSCSFQGSGTLFLMIQFCGRFCVIRINTWPVHQ